MTHSVSHNLFIELNGPDMTVATVKKNGVVIHLQFFSAISKSKLSEILDKMPDIFSNVNLLIRKKDFITIPEDFYESDWENLFRLSYDLQEANQLHLEKSEYRIGVVYDRNTAFSDLIHGKFSRVKTLSEVSVILTKVFKEVNLRDSKILVSVNKGHLTLIALNAGKLLLCNSYQTKTDQDIFYFVMLAMEQLQLIPAETELIILGEPSQQDELKELFKNYIKEVSVWKETYKVDAGVKNTIPLSQSFALQALICE